MGRKKGSLNKNKNILQEDVKQENNMTVEIEESQVSNELSELEQMRIKLEMAQLELENAKIELEIERTNKDIEQAKVSEKPKVIAHREIDEEERAIIDKHINIADNKKAMKEKIDKQRAYDNVMVTGKFINRRSPGREVRLTYNKYETDPVKWYDFRDGGTYTIPRGFADQIKDYYHTPQFVQKTGPMDPDNPESQVDYVDTSVKKYDFVPLGF